jgi:hypothetical protein
MRTIIKGKAASALIAELGSINDLNPIMKELKPLTPY